MHPADSVLSELNLTDLFPGQAELYPFTPPDIPETATGQALLNRHFHTEQGVKEKKDLLKQIGNYLFTKPAGETYCFFQHQPDCEQKSKWHFVVSRLHFTANENAELVFFRYDIDGFPELKSRLNNALENANFFKENVERYSLLTKREKEVLLLIAQGYSSRDISATTHTSLHTVNTHRNKIRKKLVVSNSSEMLKYALAFDHHQNVKA